MKFMERIRVHPERIPTKEHYEAVFDHYEQYHNLGGNHYVDLVMQQIAELYKQHYEPNKHFEMLLNKSKHQHEEL